MHCTRMHAQKTGALPAVHYSDGTRDKRFRLPFPEAKLVLLQELLESSLPTIAGFGRLARPPRAGWPQLRGANLFH